MRFFATTLGVVVAASLTLSPAIASPGPGNKPPTSGKPASAGKPTTTGKPTKTTAPMTSGAKSVASSTAHNSAKPTSAGKPTKPASTGPGKTNTAATNTKAAKSPSTSTTGKPTKTAPANTAVSTPAAGGPALTTTGSTTLNPIASKIASKQNLNSKITGMLPIDPVTGVKMTLDHASLGFKNQGQFIAALHVSQNLGIPFTELKSHMVTVTPGAPGQLPTATQTGSLGQAIQASKSTAVVTTEVERAESQATVDLRISETTTTSTSTTSTSPKTKTAKKTPFTFGAR
jgi:hypothetical protein